ncbi:MAG: glutamine--fructose-6-phosphate transaminase (isomerizing) [Thermoplasmatota archaeon]
MLVRALARLEYRGYDSAGVAVATAHGLDVQRVVGRVARLATLELPDGATGIGHTRWATHGRPNEENAHPHRDCTGDFAIVHNGIIENHVRLREALEGRGHRFSSETDTEVLAHLVEEKYAGNLVEALREALAEVEGTYAVALVSARDPGVIVAARERSPLLVGYGMGENFIASDATALLDHTRRVTYVLDGEIVRVTRDEVRVFGRDALKEVPPVVHELKWSLDEAEKGGFPHFMLKEIHEIPRALREALHGRLANLDLEGSLGVADLARARRFLILGCGTSYHAALVARPLIERLAMVPVEVRLASEYRHSTAFADPDTVAILVSQSGETADTIGALARASLDERPTLAIVNVVGSTLSRDADATLFIRAGPEIGVAATKTFVNSLAALYLLAYHVGQARGAISAGEARRLAAEFKALPRLAQQALELEPTLSEIAKEHLASPRSAFFLGRQENYGIALEGALKLKEISYVHAEGYAAGELKHGPLALLEPGTPVFALLPRDATYSNMVSSVGECRAREADVIGFFEPGDIDAEKIANRAVRLPPCDPLFFAFPATIALYLLAYHAAAQRDLPIDMPRNLAKSVTVE